MTLARFHMLREAILPRKKTKLPEQQQCLWKRLLALLPDLLDAVTPPQPAELQRAGGYATLARGTQSFQQVSR